MRQPMPIMDAALETFKHLFAKQQPTPTVDAALEAVKNLSATIDEAGRRKLITSLHELAYSLEDANDTVHRLGYLVSSLSTLAEHRV